MRRKPSRLILGSIFGFFTVWLSCSLIMADQQCEVPWVAQHRTAARKAGKRFAIVRDSAFQEQAWSYVVGITYAPEEASLTLAIFGSSTGEPHQIFSQQIGILSPEDVNPDAELADTCPAPDFGLYFKVTVLDLNADGTHEIVVESNEGGTCAKCLSEVRVYKVSASAVKQVVDETYNDISYGAGKGLTVNSFTTDASGKASPTHKTFFMPKAR